MKKANLNYFNNINCKWKILSIFLFILFFSFALKAQELTVRGKVTDANGFMPGVSIKVKDATGGTVTDENGNYSIVTSANAIIQFSFLGYKEETINVDNREVIDIIMKSNTESLKEVVVVGYGTQQKKDVVGSISSVSAEKISESGSPNVVQALQGVASGISVNRSSDFPSAAGFCSC